MRFAKLLLISAVAVALNTPPAQSARAQAPELPSLGDAAGEEFPPAVERKLGEQIMLEVRRDPSYLPDPETSEYLNHLGYQLVAVSPSRTLDFSFFAIRDPLLNAFALPGGFIGIHSGLIVAAQNESELAGVVAHEIGHVTQRHIARMLAKQKESTALALGALLLAILAARAGGSSSGDLAQAAMMGGQAALIQQQLNFSRDAEREADRVGLQMLLDGGFDGHAMESFFARLQASSRIIEGTAPAYLRSHPMTVERMSDMQNRTREMRIRQRPDSLDFVLVRARLRVLQENSVQGWLEALEHFEGQLKQRTTTSDAAAHYGAAVAALKLARNDLALTRALAARKAARSPSVIVDKIVTEARFAAAKTPQERAEAVAAAAEVTARYPLSPLAAHHYVDLLHQTAQHEAAIDFLRNQQAIQRTQPVYHGMLGRAYSALDRRSLHHQSVAEMYSLMGARMPAIHQLELARRAGDGDFFTMSEIDARLRELQIEVRRDNDGREISARRPGDDRAR